MVEDDRLIVGEAEPAAGPPAPLRRRLAEHVPPAGAGNDDDAVTADPQASGHVRGDRLGHRVEADRQTSCRRVDDLGGAQLVPAHSRVGELGR